MNIVPQNHKTGNNGLVEDRPCQDNEVLQLLTKEIEHIIFNNPGVIEAIQVASGKYTLDEKESALRNIHKAVNSAINEVCLAQEKGYQGSKTLCLR